VLKFIGVSCIFAGRIVVGVLTAAAADVIAVVV